MGANMYVHVISRAPTIFTWLQVVSISSSVKIRAEDGRSITHVDISPFISNLPQGRPTTSFTSEDASGSTSQAAAIIESLELGAQCLLIDEDTSATNFMIRDMRMQLVVSKDKEPIVIWRCPGDDINKLTAHISDPVHCSRS